MDFALNDEQKMMIDTIRRFIAEELHPLEDALENTGTLPEADAHRIHAKAKELGLYALNMPAELGGGGLSNLDRIICEEQFGHTSDMLIRRAFGNVYEPLLHCKGEQVERWLKPAVEGTRTCAITITESGAGSDAAGIKTHAKRNEQGQWVLNGSKHFISDGIWSDFFLVSAKTGEKEISMFMVDKGLPGFTVGKDQAMMGLRGTPHLELFFDNVELTEADVLGEVGKGFNILFDTLNPERIILSGLCTGVGRFALKKAVAYANDRKVFNNTPIGAYQGVQHPLAIARSEIEMASLMALKAAWAFDQGLPAGEFSNIAKYAGAEAGIHAVDAAIQTHGGNGFTKEYGIYDLYGLVRLLRTAPLNRELVLNYIAEHVMGLPRSY